MNTTKVAWNEVRDNVERGTNQLDSSWSKSTIIAETQARQAFLHTLTTDIIHPLTTLKAS